MVDLVAFRAPETLSCTVLQDIYVVARLVRGVAARLAGRADVKEELPRSLPELSPDSPYLQLGKEVGLSPEALTVWRILSVGELDRITHRCLRSMAQDPSRTGVEVDVLVAVAGALGCLPLETIRALGPSGPLLLHGLVAPAGANESTPILTRRVRVAPRVLDYLCGTKDAPEDPQTIDDLPFTVEAARPLHRLTFLPAEVDRVRKLLARAGQKEVLWLVGARSLGKRALLGALCREQSRRLLCLDYQAIETLEPKGLAPRLWCESLLCRATLCIYNASPSAPQQVRALYGLCSTLVRARLPVVFTTEEEPSLAELELSSHAVTLSGPGQAERLALWQAEVPDCTNPEELAAQFRVVPGRIVRAAETARRVADEEGRSVEPVDIVRAVSQQVAQKVSVLGTRIEDRQTWEDVVLATDTMEAVRELIARVRFRDQVVEKWGFQRKMAKGMGLAALFSGHPGTGKTMLASLIAKEVNLELYQIDLSQIVSKYVGETEKQLAQVFEAAEGSNVLLLFDEADSLFSKRTDVRSSNDRYSNLEVNYLLQRIERFEGVCILTTNLEGSIDPAFARRLAFRIQFPLPNEEERALLWQRMIPKEAEVGEAIDFVALGSRYELTGGNIRNATLRAAYLAAAEKGPILQRHIDHAVQLEYRDAGRISTSGRLN